MRELRQLRPFVLLCVIVLALAPAAANAADTSEAHHQKEVANRAARCDLVLSGHKVSGKLNASQCATTSTVEVAGVQAGALATSQAVTPSTQAQNPELANRLARCALVLAGKKIPGNLHVDECKALMATAGTTKGEVRALGNLPGSACPLAPGATLTKADREQINAFAHAKAKAEHNNLPEPKPSPEVAALMAC